MKYVKIEKKDRIAILAISRPEALNALNTEVLSDISAAVDQAAGDDEVLVLIITGEGKSFVSGADIAKMKDLTAVESQQFSDFGNNVFLKIENLAKPVIAAINGYALGGGCELAMSCDLRIASDNAKFGQPEVGLGITPGFGGTQRLPRLIGAAKAKELIFTARIITAQDAYALGLLNRVVARDELMDAALELANEIAKNAQVAVRQSKRAINRGLQADISTGLAYEADASAVCYATVDQKNAMAAFVEKRKPDPFVNK